jgi:hypothetical protein
LGNFDDTNLRREIQESGKHLLYLFYPRHLIMKKYDGNSLLSQSI